MIACVPEPMLELWTEFEVVDGEVKTVFRPEDRAGFASYLVAASKNSGFETVLCIDTDSIGLE